MAPAVQRGHGHPAHQHAPSRHANEGKSYLPPLQLHHPPSVLPRTSGTPPRRPSSMCRATMGCRPSSPLRLASAPRCLLAFWQPRRSSDGMRPFFFFLLVPFHNPAPASLPPEPPVVPAQGTWQRAARGRSAAEQSPSAITRPGTGPGPRGAAVVPSAAAKSQTGGKKRENAERGSGSGATAACGGPFLWHILIPLRSTPVPRGEARPHLSPCPHADPTPTSRRRRRRQPRAATLRGEHGSQTHLLPSIHLLREGGPGNWEGERGERLCANGWEA